MAKRTTRIIQTIIETLEAKPVRREEILDILIAAYPERDKIGMANTVNACVPYRLIHEKRLDVVKTGDGKFFIQKTVTTEQPTTPDNS